MRLLQTITTPLLAALLTPFTTTTTPVAAAAAAAAITPRGGDNETLTSAAYSTRMIASVMTRQQGLVSSGQVTSTLESGLIALALQSWLDYYYDDEAASSSSSSSSCSSSSAGDGDGDGDDNNDKNLTETASSITAYLEAMLATISATEEFTNVSKAVALPMDRLTVGQALGNLGRVFEEEEEEVVVREEEEGTSPGGGGGGQRELTETEMLALDTLNTSLALQSRNQYGGFWYYVYPNWSYLDGTVSFLPFMASSNAWSRADILNQITLLWTHCAQQTSNTNTTTNATTTTSPPHAGGLLVHGYDASKTAVWAHPSTGGSPYVWGRSLGWYLAGLVNAWEALLPLLPNTPPNPNPTNATTSDDQELMRTIQSQFTTLVTNLLPYADPATGAWWQLTTFPGRAGNFPESSSTALFVFSILKGVRLGLLASPSSSSSSSSSPLPPPSPSSPSYSSSSSSSSSSRCGGHNSPSSTTPTPPANFTAAALRAYHTLVTDFLVAYANGTLGYNGTVAVCSLNSSASYEYYTQRPLNFNAPLGEGAFILASLEVERLGL